MLPKKLKKMQILGKLSPRGMSFERWLVFSVTSVIVMATIIASVWITFVAIGNRIRLARAENQIEDIMEMSRRAIDSQHMNMTENVDLLMLLSRMDQLSVTGEINGRKIVQNPWGRNLIAYTLGHDRFRMETSVSTLACIHIIDFLAPHIKLLGIKAIDTKGGAPFPFSIYDADKKSESYNHDIALADCAYQDQMTLGLTFSARPPNNLTN